MGIEKILAIEVDHCPQSYACLLLSSKHGKILYSGDTLPCQNLFNYAQKARVLIHEATLQDGMEEDAYRKKHATTSQAINIGVQCGVWRTILTHFSPRYTTVSEIPEACINTKTLVAFDHMRVSLSQLEWVHEINHLYRNLLKDEDEEEQEEEVKKTEKSGKK